MLVEARTCTGWPEPEAGVIPFWTWMREAGVSTGSFGERQPLMSEIREAPAAANLFPPEYRSVTSKEKASSPNGLVPGLVCGLSVWS